MKLALIPVILSFGIFTSTIAAPMAQTAEVADAKTVKDRNVVNPFWTGVGRYTVKRDAEAANEKARTVVNPFWTGVGRYTVKRDAEAANEKARTVVNPFWTGVGRYTVKRSAAAEPLNENETKASLEGPVVDNKGAGEIDV